MMEKFIFEKNELILPKLSLWKKKNFSKKNVQLKKIIKINQGQNYQLEDITRIWTKILNNQMQSIRPKGIN